MKPCSSVVEILYAIQSFISTKRAVKVRLKIWDIVKKTFIAKV